MEPLQIGEVNPLAPLPTQPGVQVPARVDDQGVHSHYSIHIIEQL